MFKRGEAGLDTCIVWRLAGRYTCILIFLFIFVLVWVTEVFFPSWSSLA